MAEKKEVTKKPAIDIKGIINEVQATGKGSEGSMRSIATRCYTAIVDAIRDQKALKQCTHGELTRMSMKVPEYNLFVAAFDKENPDATKAERYHRFYRMGYEVLPKLQKKGKIVIQGKGKTKKIIFK